MVKKRNPTKKSPANSPVGSRPSPKKVAKKMNGTDRATSAYNKLRRSLRE